MTTLAEGGVDSRVTPPRPIFIAIAILHCIGTHTQLFGGRRLRQRQPVRRPPARS
jgi:hypothetical protein